MTWVNLKKVEQRIEHRVMVLINSKPDRGYSLIAIFNYFRPQGIQAKILKEDVPGWEHLGENKRMNRINKVVRRLVRDGRARMVTENGDPMDMDSVHRSSIFGGERLIPLNALDKIVYALEQDEQAEAEPSA